MIMFYLRYKGSVSLFHYSYIAGDAGVMLEYGSSVAEALSLFDHSTTITGSLSFTHHITFYFHHLY